MKTFLRPLAVVMVSVLLAAACGGSNPSDSVASGDQTATATASASSTAEQPTTVEADPTTIPEPTATVVPVDDDEPTDEVSDDELDLPGLELIESRAEAVAFFLGEGLHPDDVECLVDEAYDVLGTWDLFRDTTTAEDVGLEAATLLCVKTVIGPAAGSSPPGDDPELDALWARCDEGDGDACDSLYFDSPLDSEYEAFGLTCGGRTMVDDCVELLGGDNSTAEVPAPGSPAPGDEPDLDVLWEECATDGGEACDSLSLTAPIDSSYELFGLTCGGYEDLYFPCANSNGSPASGISSSADAIAFLVGRGVPALTAACLADASFDVLGTWDITAETTPSQEAQLDELAADCP